MNTLPVTAPYSDVNVRQVKLSLKQTSRLSQG